MSNKKKKRGRPMKDGARRHTLHILVSDEEYELLSNTSKKVGKSMSEIARKGSIIAAKGESDLYDMQHGDNNSDDF